MNKLDVINNSLNILSNFALLLPALYFIIKDKKITFLYLNIILLAITSGYYHINPSHQTI